MRTLQIVRSAYRCNLEEQDDPVLWLALALRGAGATVSVLLRGSAVSYAVRGQDASGLQFGDRRHTMAPRIERDVDNLIAGGSPVYAVLEDIQRRGIAPAAMLPGILVIRQAEIAHLFAQFDALWHW